MCFEGIARLSRRVWRRFVRGSREISLVPSLHRASTDALIWMTAGFWVDLVFVRGFSCTLTSGVSMYSGTSEQGTLWG